MKDTLRPEIKRICGQNQNSGGQAFAHLSLSSAPLGKPNACSKFLPRAPKPVHRVKPCEPRDSHLAFLRTISRTSPGEARRWLG